jgi:proline racemase
MIGVMVGVMMANSTSAIMAVRHARGEQALEEEFVNEGILGAVFRGRLTAG